MQPQKEERNLLEKTAGGKKMETMDKNRMVTMGYLYSLWRLPSKDVHVSE
jgi:hypothetical protein